MLELRMYALMIAVVLATTGCGSSTSDDAELMAQASVEGSVLSSSGFPTGAISMAPTLTYVGRDLFVLYGVASCEIHLFVEAARDGRVLRLYWFQFEGYLPSWIPRSYDYSDDAYRTPIGDKEFYDSVSYYNVTDSRDEWRADSDIMHVIRLLKSQGYRLEDDVMRIRFVHLDEEKKKELMIIYMEDLAQHDLTVSRFDGPEGQSRWDDIQAAMRVRALSGMTIDIK